MPAEENGLDGSSAQFTNEQFDTELEKRPDAYIFVLNKASWDESLEEIKNLDVFLKNKKKFTSDLRLI